MDLETRIEHARAQWTAILSQFSRFDSQAAVLLGVIVAMIALLATNAPPLHTMNAEMVFAVVPLLLLAASLGELYVGAFPRLEGGQQSLVYFKEIAARTEARFISDFRRVEADAYLDDLLSQVWRNSEILSLKFQHLKRAFQLLAWGIIPWGVVLLQFASLSAGRQHLIAK